jgi:hypothetical protein
MYCPPTASQRAAVIAERIEANNSASFWAGWSEQVEFAI